MAKGKLHTGPKGGKYRIKNGKKVYEKKEAKKVAPRKARVAKIHVGKKGGEYYMKKGKRVYLEPESAEPQRYKKAELGSMKVMPGWWGAPAVPASYKKPAMPASMKKKTATAEKPETAEVKRYKSVALGSVKAPGWWGAPAVPASYKKPASKKLERRHTVGA